MGSTQPQVPATTLLLGGIFLDDTPNSLIERGHPGKVCW